MNKRLRLFVKNITFKYSQNKALKRLEKLMQTQPSIQKNDDSKNFLFNLIYGMYGHIMFWECGLAKALQMRGHDVKALICGKTLTMCTAEYTIDSVHDDKTCKHCVDFSKKFLEIVGIPYATYHEYISNTEMDKIKDKVNDILAKDIPELTYKNVHIGSLSKNSALRYYKGYINPDKTEYESILRKELVNAFISTDIAEKIAKNEKPDALVTRHLGYAAWGSFAEYCTNQGVRICSPTKGLDKKSLKFDIFDMGAVNDAFSRYYNEVRKKTSLNADEKEELKTYMDNRIMGSGGDTAEYMYTPGEIEKENLDFDKYERTYGIFPNVPWDASLRYANKGFNGVHEWILDTIEMFKEKPNYQLLIKIHPSELRVMKSENTVLDFIKNHYDSLPDNIKIIPPDTKISPYDLFQHIDIGIVYNGTIGMELSINDVPVVVAGRTHYGEKGFTFDVSTKKEYKDVLFGNIMTLDEDKKKLAKAYSYFYLIKSFVPYDYVSMNPEKLKYGWNIKSLDEFSEGKNKYLDHICNYIAYDTVYQDW